MISQSCRLLELTIQFPTLIKVNQDLPRMPQKEFLQYQIKQLGLFQVNAVRRRGQDAEFGVWDTFP